METKKKVVHLVLYTNYTESYPVAVYSSAKKAAQVIETQFGGSRRYTVETFEVE